MSEGCKYETCHYLANESGYCPRHQLLIQEVGSEDALMDQEFGCECKACGERDLDVELGTCPDCNMDDVCPECMASSWCCERAIAGEDDDDSGEA
jgi:hypothetical protein